MATKFTDFMVASPNPRGVLCKLGVYKDTASNDLYIEEKDPAGGGGVSSTIVGPLGQKHAAASVSVTLADDQPDINVAVKSVIAVQRSKANAPLYVNYVTSPTSAAAWTQLIAATSAQSTKIHVFDSNGIGWFLAFGGAGAEVAQVIIPPGGDNFELLVPVGTRISSRAVDDTALSVGSLQMSLLS